MEVNNVASFFSLLYALHFREQMWGYIPLLARIRDDGDSLLIEFNEGTDFLSMAPWLKADLIAWREFHHFFVRVVRLQEFEPLHNSVVQLDQFFFS